MHKKYTATLIIIIGMAGLQPSLIMTGEEKTSLPSDGNKPQAVKHRYKAEFYRVGDPALQCIRVAESLPSFSPNQMWGIIERSIITTENARFSHCFPIELTDYSVPDKWASGYHIHLHTFDRGKHFSIYIRDIQDASGQRDHNHEYGILSRAETCD
jgi:hypothetical protein